MIIPSLVELCRLVDTLAGRDNEDQVVVTLTIADLRVLAWLVDKADRSGPRED